jgi:hypothetical protein
VTGAALVLRSPDEVEGGHAAKSSAVAAAMTDLCLAKDRDLESVGVDELLPANIPLETGC